MTSESAPKPRRRRLALDLLVALLAGQAVAFLTLVVVAISSLIYAWDLQSRMFGVAKGLVAIVLAILVGHAIYGTAKAARRRHFQFSLRGLLLATAVVALLLGTLGNQVIRHRDLRQVCRAGASFVNGSLVPSGIRWWLQSQLGYDLFGKITIVHVESDQAFGEMAAHREYFSDVDSMTFMGWGVTDKGLADADALARLPCLRHVSLLGTSVTSAGLESLSRWSQVESLFIHGSLGLTSNSGNGITDAGLAHLRQMPRLKTVHINSVGITDAGLKHLEGIKQLKRISLVCTSVSEAGAKQLQQALPNCDVKGGQ